MSNIVEELRSAADTGHDSTGYVMKAAADEIARLRARLDNYIGTIGRENVQLEEENERLRAVVEYYASLESPLGETARRALQPKEGKK